MCHRHWNLPHGPDAKDRKTLFITALAIPLILQKCRWRNCSHVQRPSRTDCLSGKESKGAWSILEKTARCSTRKRVWSKPQRHGTSSEWPWRDWYKDNTSHLPSHCWRCCMSEGLRNDSKNVYVSLSGILKKTINFHETLPQESEFLSKCRHYWRIKFGLFFMSASCCL